MKFKKEHILLAAILMAALAIRLWPVTANLPYTYWHDENNYIETAMRFGTGDFRLVGFSHGGGYQLILFVEFVLFFLASKVLGLVSSSLSFYVSYVKDPTPFFLMARITAALCGTAIIYLTYLIGAKVYNRRAALAASFFTAFSLITIQMSSFALADMPSVAIFMVSFLLLVYSAEKPSENVRYYVACLLLGFAAACKYYVGLGAISVFVAAFIKCKGSKAFLPRFSSLIIFGSAVIGIGFIAGMPSFIFDLASFYKDTFVLMGGEYIFRNPNKQTWLFYFTNHLRNGLGLPLEIAALAGIAYAAYKRSKWDLLVLSFPVFYYLLFMHSVGYAYHMLPVIPFILILGGRLLDAMTGRLFRRFSSVALASLCIVVILPTFSDSARYLRILSSPDTRTEAKAWVEINIPENSSILAEGYLSAIAIHSPSLSGSMLTMKRDLDKALLSGGSGFSAKVKMKNFDAISKVLKAYDLFTVDTLSAEDLRRIDPSYIIMTGDNDLFSGAELGYYVKEDYSAKRQKLKDDISDRYRLVRSFQPTDRFTWWFPHLTDHDYRIIRNATPEKLKNYIRGPVIDIYRNKNR